MVVWGPLGYPISSSWWWNPASARTPKGPCMPGTRAPSHAPVATKYMYASSIFFFFSFLTVALHGDEEFFPFIHIFIYWFDAIINNFNPESMSVLFTDRGKRVIQKNNPGSSAGCCNTYSIKPSWPGLKPQGLGAPFSLHKIFTTFIYKVEIYEVPLLDISSLEW